MKYVNVQEIYNAMNDLTRHAWRRVQATFSTDHRIVLTLVHYTVLCGYGVFMATGLYGNKLAGLQDSITECHQVSEEAQLAHSL